MAYFHRNILSLAVICICMAAIGLSGCGRQQEAPSAGTATGTKAPGVKTPEEEPKAPAVPSTAPITEERTYYDFESDLNGWEVPMWAQGKTDHVAKTAEISKDIASKGEASMKIETDFPGGFWAGALVEIQQYLDMSRYRVIRTDIYLPADAPIGLRAKLILTVGDTWKFVEQSGSVPLIPGEWVTITASIEPGSYDWKRVVPDEKFAEDVRKIAVRIESNRKPKYAGPIYVDNIRVGR